MSLISPIANRLIGAAVLASFAVGVPGPGANAEAGPPPVERGGAGSRAARLWVGFAEVMDFDRVVGTIVVGDAGVIDATVVDERRVVLTALAAGRTNVVVLGQNGAVLSRLSVIVQVPAPPTATLYRGTEGTTLICDPGCRPGNADATGQPAE